MQNTEKRSIVYDIEKGFLIISVVIGHLVSENSLLHQIIFSFHIPVFFMITGMLSHWGTNNKEFIRKRTKGYVMPYFVWCIALYLLLWFESPLKFVGRMLYGGAMNTTHYTYTYWFICCLFLSSVLFNFLWKNKKALIAVLTLFLIGWYSTLIHCNMPILPWSLEIVPFAIMYFVIGMIVRKIEEYAVGQCGNRFYIMPLILASLLILIHYYGYSDYTIIMKKAKLSNFPLEVIYPTTYYLAIKGVSILIARTSSLIRELLVYIGNSSLVIMFSHSALFVACILILPSNITNSNTCKVCVFSIIALTIGCGGYYLFSRNKYLSLLFLGK